MDFKKHVDEAKRSPEGMSRLKALTDEAETIAATLAQLEETHAGLLSRYNYIRRSELPNVMGELSSKNLVMEDGLKVEVKDVISGSFGALGDNPDKLKAANKHLTDIGGSALIKTTVTIPFTQSQHNEALSLAAELEAKGYALDVKSAVNPQSLMKFAKDVFLKGEDIEFATLGLYHEVIATISHVSVKRPGKKLTHPKRGTGAGLPEPEPEAVEEE